MKKSKRRGVLLLVVLALLAMFAMVAVAFVVLTGAEKRTADRVRTIDAVLDSPEKTLNQAFNVVVRGTALNTLNATSGTWQTSAVTSHSLLEGIYGSDGYVGPMAGAAAPVAVLGGQLIEFSVNDPYHKVGCVLTMTSGQCAGLSTRIVGLDPPPDPLNPSLATTSPKIQTLPFDNGAVPQATDSFIINGVPYGGMGYGFNPSSGSLDAPDSYGNPLAFLPNDPANFGPVNANGVSSLGGSVLGPIGGANADYTAPDYQTPLLALQVPIGATVNSAGTICTASPSLHRPELMAFWANNVTGLSGGTTQTAWYNWANGNPKNTTLLRQISFRPNPVDHPTFCNNVNPTFNPIWDGTPPPAGITWQWDVDNAGTGVPDSVWVDLGMPVRYTSDGRPYKPLFAILCVDLDGRLNVNAHGTLAQAGMNIGGAVNTQLANPPYSASPDVTQLYLFGSGTAASEVPSFPASPVIAPNGPPLFAANAGASLSTTGTFSRGLGYGPPEINLRPLFSLAGTGTTTTAPDLQVYQYLLLGVNQPNNPINGRYGEVTGTPLPGFANWQWPFTYNKWWDYCGSYWSNLSGSPSWGVDANNNPLPDGYASPPDPQGYAAIALDLAGRPIYCSMGGSLLNTPYDLNLSRNAPYASQTAQPAPPNGVADAPFGVGELERILRPFDRDVGMLPTRLAALTTSPVNGDPRTSVLIPKRYAVTTHSYAVQTPSIVPPPPLQIAATKAGFANAHTHHMIDLLATALISGGGTAANIPQVQATLLAPEMFAGNKLNLNRPLSNWPAARTSPVAGFALFTKPAAALPGTPDWRQSAANQFNLNPAGGNDPNLVQQMSAIQARQLLARYLYVLALLVRTMPSSNLGPDMMFYTEAIPTTNDTNPNPSSGLPIRELLNRRRLAQWAINVACFATPDSVMVPFKYNVNPFTKYGWTAPLLDPSVPTGLTQAQLHLSSTGSVTDLNSTPQACGVVWGCKPPECLITETAAFHNRRVVDSANDDISHKKRTDTKQTTDTPPKTIPADIDLDQARTPQGSFFFELYCPRSPMGSTAPSDLYTFSAAQKAWMLDLGRLAPSSTDGFTYPVWRAVITESRIANPNDDILTILGRNPDTFSFETEQVHPISPAPATPPGGSSLLSGANATAPTVTIERIVWFAAKAPQTATASCKNAERIYYNQLGTSVLLPGDQYAVVGPRPTTYISASNGGLGTNGVESIVITPGLIANPNPVFTATNSMKNPVVTSGGTQQLAATAIKPTLGIVVAGGGPGTNYPQGWAGSPAAANGIGLSISEPLFSDTFYYPKPTKAGSDGITEWYDSPTSPGTGFLDRPLEPYYKRMSTAAPAPDPWVSDPLDSDVNKQSRPLVKDSVTSGTNLIQTGTTPRYKYILLQRLANPSVAFDPVANPYRTVDWMPIDLTVYNGDATLPSWPPAGLTTPANYPYWDNDDPLNTNPKPTTTVYFQSRQRGKTTNPVPPRNPSTPDLHYQGGIQFNLWAQTSDDPAAPTFANSPPGKDSTANFNCDLQNSLGYINPAFWDNSVPPRPHPWVNSGDVPATGYGAYVGSPWQSFPWLTWNGRPYVSELELLMVPASHPGRLLWEFNYISATQPSNYVVPANSQLVAYPHLLNFFQSDTTGGTPSQIHRLLEYVGVPSRFTGTELQINPTNAASGASWFHTPFNRIPLMREPGRVNLNTITSLEVFQGLMNYYPGMAGSTMYGKFVSSRRGPNLTTGSTIQNTMVTIDPTAPTRFLRPFRSAAGAALGPAIPSGTTIAPGVMLPPREIEDGLLRSDFVARTGDPGANSSPLFQFDSTIFGISGLPPTGGAMMDSYRNAFFRYQSLQRLGNLVTTRSNVFAVWITVGYFEALPNHASPTPGQPDAGHPDGWELGPELGSDTGDILRHRAFYIFDRSIPVGFIRGQDVNHDKAVLLKRFIE